MARRKDGKMDRRTAEYQDAVARMAKARRAMGKSRAPSKSSGGQRRSDGRLDQRTAEGRAMAAKMAAMRAQRGKSSGGFFTWLFGG
jgi:hypothetical protein